MHSCSRRWASLGSAADSCGEHARSRDSAMQACATASKWPARLPLSTVETYGGDNTCSVVVSYQLYRWPLCLSRRSMLPSVAFRRVIRSAVVIQPNSRAQVTASRYNPMLVGDVRWATVRSGVICRLSGGRK